MDEADAQGRWRERCADDALIQELDFGNVIGFAFRWGEGEKMRRFGVPLTREIAEKLWRDLGQVLHGRHKG